MNVRLYANAPRMFFKLDLILGKIKNIQGPSTLSIFLPNFVFMSDGLCFWRIFNNCVSIIVSFNNLDI